MATLTLAAPSGLSTLAAPFRALLDGVDALRAAQRAAHVADDLYNCSDETLAARGLTRADVTARILGELESR